MELIPAAKMETPDTTLDGEETLQMGLRDVPRRIFLDTCVVNFMLDYAEQIHDGAPAPVAAAERVVRDVEALHHIMLVGQRAIWQLAISPCTYQEIAATRNERRRHQLQMWFADLWQYWTDVIHETNYLPRFVEAEDTRVRAIADGSLDVLADTADRVLVSDAIVYRCELFCTRDWTTILKHRADLKGLPLGIVTPVEWWSKIQPYARLWL